MYAAIRTSETIDAGEVTRRANRGLVPILGGTPGFIAYYIVDGGDGKLGSISVFEERAAAEESTRRAAEWVADNLAELVEHAPVVIAARSRSKLGAEGGRPDQSRTITSPLVLIQHDEDARAVMIPMPMLVGGSRPANSWL